MYTVIEEGCGLWRSLKLKAQVLKEILKFKISLKLSNSRQILELPRDYKRVMFVYLVYRRSRGRVAKVCWTARSWTFTVGFCFHFERRRLTHCSIVANVNGFETFSSRNLCYFSFHCESLISVKKLSVFDLGLFWGFCPSFP
jgi:hypothetical protein